MAFRFVFEHVFVANGNFKADHVQQKNSNTDIWLWDAVGMAPNQAEYERFLQAAIEQLTVSTLHLVATDASLICTRLLEGSLRK